MKKLGNLLMNFYSKDLEYAEYIDSTCQVPKLIIKKIIYPSTSNPVAYRITLDDSGWGEIDEYMVHKAGNKNEYYCSAIFMDGSLNRIIDESFYYWVDALNAMEQYLMEQLDFPELNYWDTYTEF